MSVVFDVLIKTATAFSLPDFSVLQEQLCNLSARHFHKHQRYGSSPVVKSILPIAAVTRSLINITY